MENRLEATSSGIPEFILSSGGNRIPCMGLGTSSFPFVTPEVTKQSILQAIKVGYRQFDTASLYRTEEALGEAIVESISLGLVESRDELFITSKLWCSDAHAELILPALRRSLQNLKLEYLDLYLIHWPVSIKPGIYDFPIKEEDLLPMDFNAVWAAMEDCQRLGLTKSIGVSNFSSKKLAQILEFAKIPPAVNQVELNPVWNQKKLREFCRANGIVLAAFSPLGGNGTPWGSNRVMENEVLNKIAKAKGKTVAQICLRWIHEQGVVIIVKSFNSERMKQNLEIFNWSLSEDELEKINGIPQFKCIVGKPFTSKFGPFKTIEELWDGEI